MFKLTVNVVFNESGAKDTQVIGIYQTMEEALEVARKAILSESDKPLTDTQTKNHVGRTIANAGAVYKYKDSDTCDFAEARYYWVEKIYSIDKDIEAAITLIASGVNPELDKLLREYLMDKLK